MKRICSTFLLFMLLFVISITAFASSSKMNQPDALEMSIDLQSKYVASKRDIEDADVFSQFSIVDAFFSILITVAVYSVPIIIYRYGIVKQPIEKKLAKRITIIYAIVAFIVMIVLLFFFNGKRSAGAILFWSWINYKILTSGKKQDAEEQIIEMPPKDYSVADLPISTEKYTKVVNSNQTEPTVLQTPTSASLPEIVFCRRCGSRLIQGSKFCGNCGTKIEKENSHDLSKL